MESQAGYGTAMVSFQICLLDLRLNVCAQIVWFFFSVKENPPAKDDLTVTECERIVIMLLVEGILDYYLVFNAYEYVLWVSLHSTKTSLPHSLLYYLSARLYISNSVPEDHCCCSRWIRKSFSDCQNGKKRQLLQKKW